MAEISYIIQNGEQINLKDAKGRELLAQKQTKLKAGNGISITEDGTISAAGGTGGLTKKSITVKDNTISDYSGADYTYDAEIAYAGNPALIAKKARVCRLGYGVYLSGWNTNSGLQPGPEVTTDTEKDYTDGNGAEALHHIAVVEGGEFISAAYTALSQLEDTGEDFLIIFPLVSAIVTDRSCPDYAERGYESEEDAYVLNTGDDIRDSYNEHDVALITRAPVSYNEYSEDKVNVWMTYNDGVNDSNFVIPAKFFLESLCKG